MDLRHLVREEALRGPCEGGLDRLPITLFEGLLGIAVDAPRVARQDPSPLVEQAQEAPLGAGKLGRGRHRFLELAVPADPVGVLQAPSQLEQADLQLRRRARHLA